VRKLWAFQNTDAESVAFPADRCKKRTELEKHAQEMWGFRSTDVVARRYLVAAFV